VLERSKQLDVGNFTRIHPRDLELLFEQYDEQFFVNQCRAALGGSPLRFRLSRRMTSAGAKTSRFTDRRNPGPPVYEITVSSLLLFEAFRETDYRPIVVGGIVCHDGLEALQRVFEHELVHLMELLVWTKSRCSMDSCQSIAQRFFGHTDYRHRLITPRERADVEHGIRPGTRVRFCFEGIEYVGVVNRVTRRATVLVEHPQGERYSDGKLYQKVFVPIRMLEPSA
jgi:hypothetical protein